MPKIKFELPNDQELRFDSSQYFIYPRVNNETSVKRLTYAGGGLDNNFLDKIFLGLKFVATFDI